MLTMRSSDIQSDPQIWQTLPQGEQGNEKKMPWMPKRPSSWSMGGSSCCLAVLFLQARRAAAARAACQDRPWPCLTLLRCHSDDPALPEDSSDESSRSRSRSRSSTLSSLYRCLSLGVICNAVRSDRATACFSASLHCLQRAPRAVCQKSPVLVFRRPASKPVSFEPLPRARRCEGVQWPELSNS